MKTATPEVQTIGSWAEQVQASGLTTANLEILGQLIRYALFGGQKEFCSFGNSFTGLARDLSAYISLVIKETSQIMNIEVWDSSEIKNGKT